MSEKKNIIDARHKLEREAEKRALKPENKKSYYKENVEIMNKLSALVERVKDAQFEEILDTFVLEGRFLHRLEEKARTSKETLEYMKMFFDEEN